MKKKLISNDIKKLVQSALDSAISPVKFELEQFTRIAIGDVYVTKIKGQPPFMKVTEKFNKDYAELWRHDVGKILLNELKTDDNNLYEIITNTFKALVKLINIDELDDLKSNNMVHLKLGDNVYTIIKVVTLKRHYCDKTDDYDIDYDIDDNIDPMEVDYSKQNDEPKSNSYALF